MKIALSIALAAFIFVGCESDSSTQTQAPVQSKATPVATIEIVESVSSKVDEVAAKVVQRVKEVEQKATPKTGAELYSSCAGCHGSSANKKALGKSEVINGWSVEKLQTAMNGYKDGSYGRTMKAVMKGQVMKFNDDEIKLISEHISKL